MYLRDEDVFNLIRTADPNLNLGINEARNGLAISSRISGADFSIGENNGGSNAAGLGIATFSASTPLSELNYGRGVDVNSSNKLQINRRDGSTINIDLSGATTVQDVLDKINDFETFDGTTPLADLNLGQGVPVGATTLDITRRDGSVANVSLAGDATVQDVLDSITAVEPGNLVARLVPAMLESGESDTVVLDCLSQLRLLAVSEGTAESPKITAAEANEFLVHVLALNLKFLFGGGDETLRVRLGDLVGGIVSLYQLILQHVGFDRILGQLIREIWRILSQRPIQVNPVKTMVTQVAVTLQNAEVSLGEVRLGADRLVSALVTPTQACLEDPGLEVFKARLTVMDDNTLQQEAAGFARAMHDVGLVSDYHAVFLRYLLEHNKTAYIPVALGLSSTGTGPLSFDVGVYVDGLFRDDQERYGANASVDWRF